MSCGNWYVHSIQVLYLFLTFFISLFPATPLILPSFSTGFLSLVQQFPTATILSTFTLHAVKRYPGLFAKSCLDANVISCSMAMSLRSSYWDVV
jgi:hypothetical protein